MKKIPITFFEILSLTWISTATFALFLALVGFFYTTLICLWIIILLFVVFLLFKKNFLLFTKHSKIETALLVGLFILGIFLSLYTTPTFFGGRDEGSLSTAGILLSQDHSLEHSNETVRQFFNVYGPGKALNFPGFFYTTEGNLRSQFLPAFPAYLATLHSFFGVAGLKFANLLPFVTFVFSFFLVLKRFCQSSIFAVLGTGALAFLFPITLFYKFTLTEMLFSALLWLSLHFTLRHLEEKSFESYLMIFVPLLITPFLRIEAIAFGFMLLFILILLDFKKMKAPKYRSLFVFGGLLFAISIFVNSQFFIETGKNFVGVSSANQDSIQKTFSFVPKSWKDFYMLKVLFNYNILPLLILGATFIISLFKKRRWNELVPFFFLLPALIYLIDANISLDHPWMLRRFIFAIIPLSLLYATLLLEKTSFVFRRTSVFIVAILLLLNITQSWEFFSFSQNKNLLEQTAQITNEFSENDLILISQKSSGDGWSLISEPLRTVLGKNALYFFNQNDLSKIDTSSFENIYLITSNSELENYALLNKEKVKGYTILNSSVKPSKEPLAAPEIVHTETTGTVFKINR